MCTCSPESQICPGLHPKQRGHQGERGDSASLVSPCETPPVLHPALRIPAEEGCGPEGVSAEEGREDDSKDRACLL